MHTLQFGSQAEQAASVAETGPKNSLQVMHLVPFSAQAEISVPQLAEQVLTQVKPTASLV